MLIPAAQKLVYATILNRIVMTTTCMKFTVCLGMVLGTITYTIREFCQNVTEHLRSKYVPTHKTHRITSELASDC